MFSVLGVVGVIVLMLMVRRGIGVVQGSHEGVVPVPAVLGALMGGVGSVGAVRIGLSFLASIAEGHMHSSSSSSCRGARGAVQRILAPAVVGARVVGVADVRAGLMDLPVCSWNKHSSASGGICGGVGGGGSGGM